jgi:hypothetical protein
LDVFYDGVENRSLTSCKAYGMGDMGPRNPKRFKALLALQMGILACLGTASSLSAQEIAEDSKEETSAATIEYDFRGVALSAFGSSSRSRCASAKPTISPGTMANDLSLHSNEFLLSNVCLNIMRPLAASPAHLPRVKNKPDGRFDWRGALLQSGFFLGLQHAFRLTLQDYTRHALRGPFFRDWIESVSHLRGWRDGDSSIINYVGHGMQGAVTGFIQIQNDPAGRMQEFGWTKSYRTSRLKAALWSTVYSIQFEIGPLGESAIGNVGLHPNTASKHPQAYVDLVMTPIMGTICLVWEDAVDKYFISKYELRTNKRAFRALLRSILNPGRSFANLMRIQVPWFRDTRDPTVRW